MHENPESTRVSGPSRRAFLTGSAAAVGAVGGGLAVPANAAFIGGPLDQGEDWPDGPGTANGPQAPDAELQSILAAVDENNVRAIVEKLVSFGTRHTLSTQDDPNRGIGAARDWIYSELKRYATQSNGRMKVEKQSYVQQPASRIPVATRITNVLATLKGSEGSKRTYVVSGHYDSRVTDVMNSTSDAPGADDDASGVAVAMELARVMATHKPGSPSPTRTSPTSTRTFGSRTANSSATWCSSATSPSSPGWRGSMAPPSGRWPTAPAPRPTSRS